MQLRIRPRLEILRTGPRSFLLVNPQTGAQLACGAEERYLLHLLERTQSLADLQRMYETRFGRGLEQRQVLEFIEQLRQLDLLADALDTPTSPHCPGQPVTSVPAPLSAADPGARLNRCFDFLVLLLGWMFHSLAIVPILVLALIAVNAVLRDWNRCLASLSAVETWPTLPLILFLILQTELILSLPHALMIGIAYRRFGARLHRFGIRFYEGVIPTFHCETVDGFGLMDARGRWTLLWVSSGCYLMVGSVSATLWAISRPGSGAGTFWIWMVPVCTLGLAIQWIPFFKFGSYWMLCAAVGEPRLRERALAETKAWLSLRRAPEALTRQERYWFRLYGLGFYTFRLLFDTAVILGAGYWVTHKFSGLGATLFAALVLWWYRKGLGRTLMGNTSLTWLLRRGGAWPLRWGVRLALLAVVVGIGFLPYNYEVVGECRVIPLAQHGVRAQLTDEIVKVHVKEGDAVGPGSVIVTLSGRMVRDAFLTARADLEKAQAHLDLMRAGPRPEDIKVAIQKVEVWKVRIGYLEEQMKREERLLSSNAASREQYDKYRQQLDSAREEYLSAQEHLLKLKSGYREEEIRSAEAAVKHQEERVRHYEDMVALTRVTTPDGGVVVTPYMEQQQGQQVKAGDLIAVLQDLSRLQVEVAADDAAAAEVRDGMRVHVRLHGLYGRLLSGRVVSIARSAEQDSKFGLSPVRGDRENDREQLLNPRVRSSGYHVRVYVELDDYPPELSPEMTGYARIVVAEDDLFWRALARPVVRFLRTEVWSWLP